MLSLRFAVLVLSTISKLDSQNKGYHCFRLELLILKHLELELVTLHYVNSIVTGYNDTTEQWKLFS